MDITIERQFIADLALGPPCDPVRLYHLTFANDATVPPALRGYTATDIHSFRTTWNAVPPDFVDPLCEGLKGKKLRECQLVGVVTIPVGSTWGAEGRFIWDEGGVFYKVRYYCPGEMEQDPACENLLQITRTAENTWHVVGDSATLLVDEAPQGTIFMPLDFTVIIGSQ